MDSSLFQLRPASAFAKYIRMADQDKETGSGIWDENSYHGNQFRRRF
jgi:hypothetical protein